MTVVRIARLGVAVGDFDDNGTKDAAVAYISLVLIMVVGAIVEPELPIALLLALPRACEFSELPTLFDVSSWSAKSASNSSLKLKFRWLPE